MSDRFLLNIPVTFSIVFKFLHQTHIAMRKMWEFLWSVYSQIWTEYGNISISFHNPFLVHVPILDSCESTRKERFSGNVSQKWVKSLKSAR